MGLSPMMQQYLNIKEENKDCLLFFRLGDFYEMFFDDAKLVSKELELTLTGRDCGLEERAPMCGVPYHALDTYLAKLIQKGYKVAICEQMTPPDSKGIVKREIVRIVTPGTVIDDKILPDSSNNFLVSVSFINNEVGVAWTDISTGELNYAKFDEPIGVQLNDFFTRIKPAEIICNQAMLTRSVELSSVKYGNVCNFSLYNEPAFDPDNAKFFIKDHLKTKENILSQSSVCISAVGGLLSYVLETQKRELNHLAVLDENRKDYMILDNCAIKNLELVESMSDNRKKGSLIWLINKTETNMGYRLLRKWILNPSINANEINTRLDAVDCLTKSALLLSELKEALSEIADLERIGSKLSFGNMQPKDCIGLKNSLISLPKIKAMIFDSKNCLLNEIANSVPDFNEITSLLLSAIVDEPSSDIKSGGVIRKGFDEQLDEFCNVKENANNLLAQLEHAEKEETGIKTLKIGFNKVFGYYIEVSKLQSHLVPYRYVRKQTIANGERYITDELKILEDKILNAEDFKIKREIYLYTEILKIVSSRLDDIFNVSKQIALLDCLCSHAKCANELNFKKPVISNEINHIKIHEGRHCVVEKLIGNEVFVPNDALLDENENRLMLITGPNMAGKSVFMRQVAIITILAHIGSFVPAEKAEISITDRIFTRVGASDDLSTGRSTFMVEMSEVSNILNNLTEKSLILLDEVGRGTSTYDGLSIAWAIMEYLTRSSKSKILFSTHYHELTELEGVLNGVKNYKFTAKEFNNTIVFLRKLLRGGANKSFGIEVASLAGLPQEVVCRSKEILKKLESADIARQAKMNNGQQLSVFNSNSTHEISQILKDLDVENITPRNALDILTDLKEKINNG